MSCVPREDDFEERRRSLATVSDEELHARFWQLVERIVLPLVEEAREHTTPAIERAVLLRMGFTSREAAAVVERALDRDRLGHGVGALVLELARARGTAVREAGLALAGGDGWEELGP